MLPASAAYENIFSVFILSKNILKEKGKIKYGYFSNLKKILPEDFSLKSEDDLRRCCYQQTATAGFSTAKSELKMAIQKCPSQKT